MSEHPIAPEVIAASRSVYADVYLSGGCLIDCIEAAIRVALNVMSKDEIEYFLQHGK